MNKQTGILITILILITGVLIGLSLYNPSLSPTVTTKTVTPIAQTSLTITAPLASENSSLYRSDVSIRTNSNKVTAVQIELSYDKDVLYDVDITPGTFFTSPTVLLKNIDTENGRITYALGVPLGSTGGIMGQGPVATLNFSENDSTKSSTTINFDKKSLVSAEGVASSVLKSSTGITFILNPLPFASPSAR